MRGISGKAGLILLIGAGLIVLVGAGLGVIILLWSSPLRDQLLSIGEVGEGAAFLYTVVFAVGTVLFLPGSLLSMVAGALFGPVTGTVVVFIGASIGASAAFLIARSLLRRRIEERLRSSPTLGEL